MEGELKLSGLRSQLNGKAIDESLKSLATLYPRKVIFTTSFGIEDQVITHFICENDLPVEIVTLDTGRLFPETYKVFNETIKKYKVPIKVFFPEHDTVEEMVSKKGPYSFYYSPENRIECCRLRKVIPLERALKGKDVWISGIRSEQSDSRQLLDWIEYDNKKNLFKFYPLFDWSYDEVKAFALKNEIPYNSLHDKGFVSIGCEPCTRAVEPGEDFRSGRWWWENGGSKECGLHHK
jgi:phosphoadenosine phosphosulfate reductase